MDGMAIVNSIPMSEIINTCNDFAQVFPDQLINMAGDYDEWKLVSTPLSENKINEKKTDKGGINLLACHGNYLNLEYF